MASNAELDVRLQIVEGKLSGAVELPTGSVDINDTKITDKTGWACYGVRAGINGGKLFVAVSNVADPTSDGDFQQPFIFKAF